MSCCLSRLESRLRRRHRSTTQADSQSALVHRQSSRGLHDLLLDSLSRACVTPEILQGLRPRDHLRSSPSQPCLAIDIREDPRPRVLRHRTIRMRGSDRESRTRHRIGIIAEAMRAAYIGHSLGDLKDLLKHRVPTY